MKTNYPVANLGDHVRQVSQRNKAESGTEVFSVTNSEGFTLSTDYFSKEVFSKDISNYKVVRKGQFAYNPSRINVGSIDYLRPAEKALVSPLYIVFETDAELYADYLLRYMKSDWGNAQIRANTEGAVRDSLKYKGLESIKIPLPPLDDQKRIAHLLGKVEGLIARRKQHLQQLDDLLKSVFLEMFGDPVRNEKGWDKDPFSEILTNIDSGKSPKCEAREAEEDEWGVLKLGAVTSCNFKEDENKALPQDIKPNAKDEVQAGDLLFSRKNTYELVAACTYVFETRPQLLLPDLIFRFVLKEDAGINPIFLWKLLISDSQRKKIQALAAGAAGSMPNISKTNLKQVLLPFPPIDFQNQFAAIVEKVEGLKSRYQQSLADLESLYGALSQKAFKGELDLAQVVLPVEEPEIVEKEKIDVEEKQPMEPMFELPAPEDLAVLQTAEGRKSLLGEWLNAWLEQLGEAPFSAQAFMDAAKQRLWELAEEEGQNHEKGQNHEEGKDPSFIEWIYESFEWSATEYDELKTQVFEALEQGRLTQGYDDANNRVQIIAAKG